MITNFIIDNCFSIILTIICFFASLFASKILKDWYKSFKSDQLLNYIPTIWTAIGILGTFISIVYSLCISNDDFSDIRALVRNISPAFVTSAIGIIGSIATSMLVKKEIANNEKIYEDEFYQFKINPKLSNGDTPEKILYGQYFLLNKILSKSDEHNNLLVRKMSDCASALQTCISQNSQSISSDISELKTYYNIIDSEHKKENEKYISSLNSKLSEILEVYKNTNTNIYSKLDTQNNELKNQNKVIEGFLNKLTENIKEYYNEVSERTADETKKLVESNIVDYKHVLETCNSALNSQLNEYTVKLENCNGQLTENVNRFINYISQSKDSLVNLNTDLISNENELIKSHSKEFAEKLQSSQEIMNAVSAKFIEAILTNNMAIGEMNKSVISKLDTIAEKMDKDIDNNKTSLLQAITELTDKWNSALNNHKDNLKQLLEEENCVFINSQTEVKKEWASAVKNIQKQIDEKNEKINKSFADNGNVLNNLADHLLSTGNALDNFNNVVSSFKQSYDGFANSYNSSVKDFNLSITDQIGKVKEEINSLNNNSDKLQNVIGSINDSIKTLGDKTIEAIEDNRELSVGMINECNDKSNEVLKQILLEYSNSNKEEEILKEMEKLMKSN